MKKPILITIIALLVFIILFQSNVLESLMLFLLVGAIPGTSFTIPPSAMLMLFFAIAWVAAFRLVIMRYIAVRTKRHVAKKRAEHKKRMPTRRFKQIESTS